MEISTFPSTSTIALPNSVIFSIEKHFIVKIHQLYLCRAPRCVVFTYELCWCVCSPTYHPDTLRPTLLAGVSHVGGSLRRRSLFVVPLISLALMSDHFAVFQLRPDLGGRLKTWLRMYSTRGDLPSGFIPTWRHLRNLQYRQLFLSSKYGKIKWKRYMLWFRGYFSELLPVELKRERRKVNKARLFVTLLSGWRLIFEQETSGLFIDFLQEIHKKRIAIKTES